MGVLVLVGITIVGLATSNLGGTLAVRTETAVCTALGGADCGGGSGPVAQAPPAGEQVLAAQASGSGADLNVPNGGAAPPAPSGQGRTGPGEADPAQAAAAPAQAAPAQEAVPASALGGVQMAALMAGPIPEAPPTNVGRYTGPRVDPAKGPFGPQPFTTIPNSGKDTPGPDPYGINPNQSATIYNDGSTQVSLGVSNVGTGLEGFLNGEFAMWLEDDLLGIDNNKKRAKDRFNGNRREAYAVRGAYERLFGRTPDPWTLTWFNAATVGKSVDQVLLQYNGIAPGITERYQTTIDDFITNTYQDYLGRQPTPADRAVATDQLWMYTLDSNMGVWGQLRWGTSWEKFVDGVRNTDEHRAYIPTAVDTIFREELGHLPNPEQAAHHQALLRNRTMTPAQMRQVLRTSPEGREYWGRQINEFVAQSYRDQLGREPDPAGHALHANELAAGRLTPRQLTDSLYNSPEGQAHRSNLANQHMVDTYAQYLGRPPDQEAIAHWGPRLANGTSTPQEFTTYVSGTPEARIYRSNWTNQLIVQTYREELGRAPDQTGIDHWGPLIASGQVTPQQFRDAVRAARPREQGPPLP